MVLKHQHKTHQQNEMVNNEFETCVVYLFEPFLVHLLFIGILLRLKDMFLLTLVVNYPFDNNNIQDNCITIFFIYSEIFVVSKQKVKNIKN